MAKIPRTYDSDDGRNVSEDKKFVADGDGNTAVNIFGEQLTQIIALLTANNLLWTKTEVVIPAGATVVVDNNLLVDFSRIKYFLNFKNDVTLETLGLDLTVQNNAGTITETVATRLGGPLSIIRNVTDDSVDMFLEITNNETDSVTLTFIKNIL